MPYSFFIKLLSYFVEVKLEERIGKYNNYLVVTMRNGRKRLNGKRANYSHGTLQMAFDAAFIKLKLEASKFKSLLMLGYGTGSVPMLLKHKYGFSGKIIGVEGDRNIIELGERHFKPYMEIAEVIDMDAIEFLIHNSAKFDLILIDLFVDLKVPETFFTAYFIKLIKKGLEDGGLIIMNVVTNSFHEKKALKQLMMVFNETFSDVKMLSIGGVGVNHFIVAKGSKQE